MDIGKSESYGKQKAIVGNTFEVQWELNCDNI